MKTSPSPAFLLCWLLRLMAFAEFMALIGVVMPSSWMSIVHERLGLGTFVHSPVTLYLARHLSLFYILHGGILWLASMDIKRYSGLIRYIAFSGIVFALLITALDIWYAFPWYWMLSEGPGLMVISALFLWLLRRSELDARGS